MRTQSAVRALILEKSSVNHDDGLGPEDGLDAQRGAQQRADQRDAARLRFFLRRVEALGLVPARRAVVVCEKANRDGGCV